MKKMKSFLVVLALGTLVLALPLEPARAEGGQTHGGTAIVCRNGDGSIASAEVLDSFEARELYGLKQIGVGDVAKARSELLNDLDRRFAGRSLYPKYLRDTLADLHGRFKLLDPKVRLELIPDVFPKISQKGCTIEQLAEFDDKSGKILLDSEIFKALSPAGRLTLEFHESVYLLDRKWAKAKDSVFARKLVGLLLATRWDANLDKAIAAYAFGFPKAGRYADSSRICAIQLDVGTDGSLRLTPELACRSVIDWDAFERAKSAVLVTNGLADQWEWNNQPARSRDGYSRLVLKRRGDTEVEISGVDFHRIGG